MTEWLSDRMVVEECIHAINHCYTTFVLLMRINFPESMENA